MSSTTILAEMAACQVDQLFVKLCQTAIFLTDTSKLQKVFRLYVAI